MAQSCLLMMMGQYLVFFENCAKYFERNEHFSKIDLEPLDKYHQIHDALMDLQRYKMRVNQVIGNYYLIFICFLIIVYLQ